MADQIGITVLGSGSKGNATVIHHHGNAIVIDAGFSYREFRRRCEEAGLLDDLCYRAILVTHEHTDHVCGLRVCASRLGAEIYATRGVADAVRHRDCHLKQQIMLIANSSPFQICEFSILPFTIPHDAHDPVAYTISVDGKKFALATDIGCATNVVNYALRDCDALLLESNHDLEMLRNSDRTWELKQRIMSNHGHLSNVQSAELLEKVISPRLHHLILGHLSGECNTMDLALNNMANCLNRLHRTDVTLQAARQDVPLPTVWL